ncbi:MAG: hypothetical protein OWQ54_02010 [Sulfolobaceae archaeon]|nr:hypothetical protein [Sulfolobaceae archaeon]
MVKRRTNKNKIEEENRDEINYEILNYAKEIMYIYKEDNSAILGMLNSYRKYK